MKKSNAPRAKVDALGTFRDLIAAEDIIEAACRLGAIQRQRKVDMPALVEATIAAVLPTHGAQTTAFANYISLTGQSLAPSAFYDRFSDQFAKLMREVALRAVKAVRKLTPADRRFEDFGVLLEEFSDVQVVDSTSKILQRLAASWAPSTGAGGRTAGVKWHALISLKDSLPVAESITAQSASDMASLPKEALSPGTLTIFDMGYLHHERFIEAVQRGADFLTRLRPNGSPFIAKIHVGKGDKNKLHGKRLNEVVEGRRGADVQDFLWDDQGVIDLDVRLEKDERTTVRCVAIRGPEGKLYWYLTTVGRDVLSPREIASAYRLRWNIELLFKQLKSGVGLKGLASSRRGAVMSMVYAKLTALCLARLLELSIEEKEGRHATTQLALVLALTRCAPLLLSMMMMARGVTFAQLEERLLLIASITARSRNQRRERARRKRERALGSA